MEDTAAPAAQRPSTRQRSKRLARQFLRFGIVGASGVVVNQAAVVAVKKFSLWAFNADVQDPLLNLLGTQFHVRWYHLFSVVAFVVANIWNFILNRYWTFGGLEKKPWWKQLPQFMAVGIFGLLITLVVCTALVNYNSPLSLPHDVFDNSTGLRTRAYWGNLIGVMFAIPANFLFNKFWTFRVVRDKRSAQAAHNHRNTEE
ncbi:hypothetical protein DLJ54_09455 [Corynebacterium heidelbergense]|uniref:GtrA/DPMS transmembrane domain-containing protein n=1 Tax=Corynebacterium heidelbergense TaxID=2055947 RepID=A0A364V3M2_9CORY|nr:GtrA family protein [Corynebacterium heidelbergense]RAV31233.1 hypothetical protein DLJ54_09455 [Corynebacterium heidelbergense]